jgi:hypothetical protein
MICAVLDESDALDFLKHGDLYGASLMPLSCGLQLGETPPCA